MGRCWVGVFVLGVALSACGRVSRDAPGLADAEPGADAGGTEPQRDAGVAPDLDAAAQGLPCDPADAGAVTWAKVFRGPSGLGTLEPAGLTVCGDGLCSVGAFVNAPDSAVPDAQTQRGMLLVKLTPLGEIVWSQQIGNPTATTYFSPHGIAGDALGNVTVVGGCVGQLVLAAPGGTQSTVSCPGTQNTDEHLVVLRFDGDGLFRSFTDFGKSDDYPANIQVAMDPSGRTVVAAHVGASLTTSRAVVVSWDRNGAEVFRHSLVDDVSYPTGLAFDAAGNAVLVGFFSGVWDVPGDAMDGDRDGGTRIAPGGSAICAFKLTATGELTWSRCFDGDGQQELDPQLAVGTDGSIAIAGEFTRQLDFATLGEGAPPSPTRLSTTDLEAMYVAKLTADGDFAWQRQFGNGSSQYAHFGLAITPDGTILLPGLAHGVLTIGDLTLDARNDTGASTDDTPFVAAFGPNGQPSYVRPLGHGSGFDTTNGIVLAHTLFDGLERSGCPDYYLATSFTGNVLTQSGAERADGLVLLSGRY